VKAQDLKVKRTATLRINWEIDMAYLKAKRTDRSPQCPACCACWCGKGGRGIAEID